MAAAAGPVGAEHAADASGRPEEAGSPELRVSPLSTPIVRVDHSAVANDRCKLLDLAAAEPDTFMPIHFIDTCEDRHHLTSWAWSFIHDALSWI